ncbi:MAG: orc1/cdc6 family replication initiation protein [Chthoniobacterales bacterium]|nr:orc1/cdc6 family replication initiation protein [Chthoniobacterales bacterium]
MTRKADDALAASYALRAPLLKLAKSRDEIFFKDLWQALQVDERRRAASLLLSNRRYPRRPAILRKAAQVLKLRPQSITTLPLLELANATALAKGLDEHVCSDLLKDLLIADSCQLIEEFLQQAGIPHEGCIYVSRELEDISDDRLATAANHLLRLFPANQVLIYLLYLHIQNLSAFAGLGVWLGKLDGRTIEVAKPENASPKSNLKGAADLAEADSSSTLASLEKLRVFASDLASRLFAEHERLSIGKSHQDFELNSDLSLFAAQHQEVFVAIGRLRDATYFGDAASGPAGSAQSDLSLDQMQEMLRELDATGERIQRSRGIAIVEPVARLRHRTNNSFAPLDSAREAARKLISSFKSKEALNPSDLEELHQLLLGSHPLLALLVLVRISTTPDLVEESETERIFNLVESAFGRSLAIAAPRLTVDEQGSVEQITSGETVNIRDETEHKAEDPQYKSSSAPIPENVDSVSVDLRHDASGNDSDAGQIDGEIYQHGQASKVEETSESWASDDADENTRAKPSPSLNSASHDVSTGIHDPLAWLPETRLTEPSASIFAITPPGALYPLGTPTDPDETRPQFLVPDDLTEILRDAKSKDLSASRAARDALAWHLMARGQPSLAAHLAGSSDADESASAWRVPARFCRLVTLALCVVDAAGSIADAIREEVEQVDLVRELSGVEDEVVARRLLLIAAALRPAMLSPFSGTGQLLADLYHIPGLDSLRDLAQAIVTYSTTGLPLSPEVLGRVAGQAEWSGHLRELSEEARSWFDAAQAYSINYQAATVVWRKWLENGGFVEALLRPVFLDETSELPRLRLKIEGMARDQDIERLVEQTDGEIPNRRRGQPIHARALNRLKSSFREALSLAQRWVDLREVNPQQGRGRRFEPAVTLRYEVTALQSRVLVEIEEALSQTQSVRMRAGLTTVRAAVRDIASVFTSPDAVLRPEPNRDQALNAALLKIPAVRFGEAWELNETRGANVSSAILDALGEGSLTLADAVAQRIGNGDFVSARLGIDFLVSKADGSAAEDLARVSALQDEFGSALQRDRLQTRGEAERLELELERAVSQGVINDQDRNALSARLSAINRTVGQTDDLVKLQGVLREVSDSLVDHQGLAKDRVTERMNREGVDRSHPEYSAIAALLDRVEILAAEDYLEIAIRGERPPETLTSEERPLRTFLHAAMELEAGEPLSGPTITSRIAEGASLPGLNFGALSKEQREKAARVMDLWYQQRQTRDKPMINAISSVLEEIGFEVNDLKVEKEKERWVTMHAAPIRSASECPLPHFGSQAAGDYKLLLAWSSSTPRDIAQEIANNGGPGAAVIVLFFGRLSEADRRQCRSLSREKKVRFAILDESLLLFLCARADARLATFFDCALPFTILYPYHTTAGEVPPELFVGRQQETQALTDPNGACFVYGGRQLGKTALLRDVQRRFHYPREHRVAIYIDLKANGIGIDQPPSALWRVLGPETRRLDPTFSNSVERSDPAGGTIGAIRSWLEKDSRRRLLVLLDEADNFFEKDARAPEGGDGSETFAVSARLKGLMDETRRRFKVVFAGLHNVQRMTQLENHPLAHLGEPICIGPLIANGEWREAAALITRPLGAIGYELSPSLVSRILMQTNYYPSLIQRYCAELSKHVIERGAGRFGSRASPPYEISDQQVQEAYQSQELRARIRDSFSLTLNLDPRYRTIALALAHNVFTNDSVENAGEVTMASLREMSLYWWGEGFKDDNSINTFRALVDEMVGLGILRHARDGRAAFRSANVQLLMGTEREVETALENPANAEAYRAFAPSVYRRSGIDTRETLRSPFTAQQEASFFLARDSVSLIVGVPAADLNNVKPFLRTLRTGRPATVLRANSSSSDLASAQEENLPDGGGTKLIAVLEDVEWTELWIHEALSRAGRRRGRVHFTNVAFVSGPHRLWDLLTSRPNILEDFNRLELSFIALRPWHEAAVRQWVEDLHRSAESDLIELLRERTGFWPHFLYEHAEAIQHARPTALREQLRFADAAEQPSSRSAHVSSFGLDLAEPSRILSVLNAHGSLRDAEWRDASEMYAPTFAALVPRVREWADLLGLITLGHERSWSVNPTVAQFLPSLEN